MVHSPGREQVLNLYLISDLASETGYSVHTLKYYLRLGLIQEKVRTPRTNYRFFDDETIQRLRKIRDFRRAGRSLREIKGSMG